MKVRRQGNLLYVSRREKNEYPVLGIVMAVALLYLAPFTTSLLAIPATAICLYRVIQYDARVYAADYCVMAPIIVLSRPGEGVPLLLYLSLFAAIWYFCRRGFRVRAPYVILVLLLNYLFLRMQMDINAFVLCFGQMFTLCILLPEQDDVSAERAVKAFLLNLLISSVYAYSLRSTPGIRQITGAEAAALWGTSIKRFKGLFEDPNYYMTLLTVGIALVLKLKDSNRVGKRYFAFMLGSLTLFGILTYSKTFFLMFIMLVGIYVVWQYWNRRVFRGLAMTLLAVVAMVLIFTMENSPFAVVLTRFREGKTLSDFTTNRSDVYLLYIREISSSLVGFFFGKGMAAEGLFFDPHNVYLEITYYIGVVGLVLFVGFYISMVYVAKGKLDQAPRQNLVAKYEVLLIVLVLFFTLHGMFEPVLYANLFMAFLSILLFRKLPEADETEELPL